MTQRRRTIVAIDPATRGFAFVVLETPRFLVDWGLRGTRARSQRDLLAVVGAMIETYEPDVVVVEESSGSRRGKRSVALVGAIERVAVSKGSLCRRVSRCAVRRTYQLAGASSAHAIALRLVDEFPELLLSLPPKRKVYMSEDERMHIFTALTFALAALPRTPRSTGLVSEPS